jgi:hypothetical protein
MDINNLATLTLANAHTASTVICKANPEWGSKRFEFRSQPLRRGDAASSVGVGCNSSVLFDHEFHYWAIVTYNTN